MSNSLYFKRKPHYISKNNTMSKYLNPSVKKRVLLKLVNRKGEIIKTFSPYNVKLAIEDLLDISPTNNKRLYEDIKSLVEFKKFDFRIKKDSSIDFKNDFLIANVIVYPIMNLHVNVIKCGSNEDVEQFKMKIKYISKIIVSNDNKFTIRGKLFKAIYNCIRQYSKYNNYYINTISIEQSERKNRTKVVELTKLNGNIKDNSKVKVSLCKLDEHDDTEYVFPLTIKKLGGQFREVNVSKNYTIGYVKHLYLQQEDEKTKIYGTLFLYNGKKLDNTKTLEYYGVPKNGDTIHIYFHPLIVPSIYDSNCYEEKRMISKS